MLSATSPFCACPKRLSPGFLEQPLNSTLPEDIFTAPKAGSGDYIVSITMDMTTHRPSVRQGATTRIYGDCASSFTLQQGQQAFNTMEIGHDCNQAILIFQLDGQKRTTSYLRKRSLPMEGLLIDCHEKYSSTIPPHPPQKYP